MKEKYMKEALKLARKAADRDEVPVGCVVVAGDEIIARGYNLRENKQSVVGHAEIEAIVKANRKNNSWRLDNADLYVTLEPCVMCAGAIIQARIRNVYFAAYDIKGGAFGSTLNLLNVEGFNHYPSVTGGILEKEASDMLKEFFKEKRKVKQKK